MLGLQAGINDCLRCHSYITVHLASRFSQGPLVPACCRVWLAYPVPYPIFFSPEVGLPSPSCPLLYNAAILVVWLFWSTLYSIGQSLGPTGLSWLHLLSSFSLHGPVQGRVHLIWMLQGVLTAADALPFICNTLSSPPYLGTGMPCLCFAFLFFLLFFSYIMQAGL